MDCINSIIIGDARDEVARVDDCSIDLIMTDPPYIKECMWAYKWLSTNAAYKLKGGHYAFVYGGTYHMPDELSCLSDGVLSYFWTDILLHTGPQPRNFHRKIMSGYKPVFIFTRGEPCYTVWKGTVCDEERPDKKYHRWGQGIVYPMKVIDAFTNPGDIIFDPFCGGGNVLAAAKMLGRKYIGIEIDKEVATRAIERLAGVTSLGEIGPREMSLFDIIREEKDENMR